MRVTIKQFLVVATVLFIILTIKQYHVILEVHPHIEHHGGHQMLNQKHDPMCQVKKDHVHSACLFAIIPTIPRSKARVSYLNDTIYSWVTNFPLEGLTCFNITVVNLRPGQHPIFEQVRDVYRGDERIRFVERATPRTNLKVEPGKEPMGKWRPTVNRDVKQSRDTIELFEEARDHMCHHKVNPAGYVMLLEDDVLMCPNAPEHIYYAISQANRQYGKKGWAVLRLSMGLIGILIQCRDMDAYVKYTVDHIYDGPIDYILPEFWNKVDPEGKEHFKNSLYSSYRYNLFNHVGRVSSFPGRDESRSWDNMRRTYHRCFDSLDSLLHGKDQYHFHCLHSDVSPCIDPVADKQRLFKEDALRIVKERNMTGYESGLLLSPYHPRLRRGRLDMEKYKDVSIITDDEVSCEAACANAGFRCESELFPWINNCALIQEFESCKQCVISPSQYWGVPGNNMKYPYCEVSAVDGLMTCEESSRGEQGRVCPCVPIKK